MIITRLPRQSDDLPDPVPSPSDPSTEPARSRMGSLSPDRPRTSSESVEASSEAEDRSNPLFIYSQRYLCSPSFPKLFMTPADSARLDFESARPLAGPSLEIAGIAPHAPYYIVCLIFQFHPSFPGCPQTHLP
jgi:hypothetical protein